MNLNINYNHYGKVLAARKKAGLSLGNIHPYILQLLKEEKKDNRGTYIIFGKHQNNNFEKL